MSSTVSLSSQVPEDTARVARAAFREGSRFPLREAFGEFFQRISTCFTPKDVRP